MGCGSNKRYKKRNKQMYSDHNNSLSSKSFSRDSFSTQTETRQLIETKLAETSSTNQKHYCYNCGSKILLSDIFCANCGVQV